MNQTTSCRSVEAFCADDDVRKISQPRRIAKEAASAIAGRFNLSRRVAYQAALAMKKVPRERPKRLIDPA